MKMTGTKGFENNKLIINNNNLEPKIEGSF
jgi:hypothetical protein